MFGSASESTAYQHVHSFEFVRFLSSKRKKGGDCAHPSCRIASCAASFLRQGVIFVYSPRGLFSHKLFKFLTFHFWRIPRLRNPPLLSQCENLQVVKGFTSQNCFLGRGFKVCVIRGVTRENASQFGSPGECISGNVT